MLVALIVVSVAALLCFLHAYYNSTRLNLLQDKFKALESRKKSTEVKMGAMVEKLAPFLNQFPGSAENAKFLGQPIDYIVFEEDEVVFVEVKSGESNLSEKQRKIKRQIEEGKVSFKIYRISG